MSDLCTYFEGRSCEKGIIAVLCDSCHVCVFCICVCVFVFCVHVLYLSILCLCICICVFCISQFVSSEKGIIAISVTAAMSVSLGGPWAGWRACAKSGIK